MSIYYVTIVLCLIFSVMTRNHVNKIFMFLFCVIFTLIFGLRDKVGVDWGNYLSGFERVQSTGSMNALNTPELGYKLINIASHQTVDNIYGVIFVCTLLFILFTMYGILFLKLNPYLIFAILAPYHFVMSGMNYTRQAIALSIFIFSLQYLFSSNRTKYIITIVFAGLFHVSSLILLPLAFIDSRKRILFPLSIPAFVFIFYGMTDEYSQYLEGTMDSSGVYLRLLYLVTPIMFILLHLTNIRSLNIVIYRLSLLIVLSFPVCLGISFISTTASDRLSYYLIILSTILVMKIRLEFPNYYPSTLVYQIPLYMLITSLTAFVTWNIFSFYIPVYSFNHVIWNLL